MLNICSLQPTLSKCKSFLSYVQVAVNEASLPCIISLGYIAAFSETLAATVITSNCVACLARVLQDDSSEHRKAAAAWAVGQVSFDCLL